MKTPGPILITTLILVFFFLKQLPIYSQPLYHHFKRVKIEKKYLERPADANLEVLSNMPVLVKEQVSLIPKRSFFPKQVIKPKACPNRNISNNSREPVIQKKPFKFESSIGLNHAKDISNVQMEKWMLAMILLYSFGFILLILCIVFALTFNIPYLTMVISILAGLCIVVASIVLPLGLAGIL